MLEEDDNEVYATPQSNSPDPPGTKLKIPQKHRKRLKDLTPEEINEQWMYFPTYIQAKLGSPILTDAKVGTLNVVKQWMMLRVYAMWVEARRKYCRRNPDTTSILLRTWRTGRVSHDLSFCLSTPLQLLGVGPPDRRRNMFNGESS